MSKDIGLALDFLHDLEEICTKHKVSLRVTDRNGIQLVSGEGVLGFFTPNETALCFHFGSCVKEN